MIHALLFSCALLLVGVLLRVQLRVLRQLFVPAAVVGGLVGLAVIQLLGLLGSDTPQADGLQTWCDDIVGQLRSWPGHLIAVVFAGLLLERKGRPLRQSARRAWREGLVVWIVVLGQTTVGLLATWLFIQPWFDVPNSFGMLIETGFAGGHGTAAAMGEVFSSEAVNMSDGLDLGIFMATIGLAVSVVTGLVYVNLAVRRGWTRAGDIRLEPVVGLEDRGDPPPMARGTIRSEVLDPLVFQILLIAVATGVGIALERGVHTVAALVDRAADTSTGNVSSPALAGDQAGDSTDDRRLRVTSIISSFPLFIYTLFGGLIVRRVMGGLQIADLIDSASIQRIVGVAMEFLVVAAITTLNLNVVVRFAVPLAILVVVALAWTGFCLVFVSRWFLPREYWFELGLINYGMSTGTTATGFVLLRVIDKDLESGAAEDYALAAPLSAPFVGGGMLTLGLPVVVLEKVHIAIPAFVLLGALGCLFFMAARFAKGGETEAS